MPIMVPAMATMGIMAVIASWNNYLTPLMLLTNPNMKTLPMMVKSCAAISTAPSSAPSTWA